MQLFASLTFAEVEGLVRDHLARQGHFPARLRPYWAAKAEGSEGIGEVLRWELKEPKVRRESNGKSSETEG